MHEVVLSSWRPSIFFGAFPALSAGPEVWLLAMGICGAVLTSALVELGRVAQPRFSLGIATLGVLMTGLAGVWGENLLMVLVCWAGFDLAWALGAAALGLPARRVTTGAAVNGLSTVMLWAGALVVEGRGGSLSWRLLELSDPGAMLLLVAGMLRLGLYPLHLALPVERFGSLPGAAPLLLSPMLGWGLLTRVASAAGGALPGAPWLETLAVVTFVVGGLLAWIRPRSAAGVPWVSLCAAGAVLWAGLVAGDAAPLVLATGGASWALGLTLLHIGRGVERSAPWWTVAPALGGLALLGMPPTLGLVPWVFLTTSAGSPLTVSRGVVFVIGQALLTTAVARCVWRTARPDEPVDPLRLASRATGHVLAGILLIAGGIRGALAIPSAGGPSLVGLGWPGVVGLGLWLAGTAAGALLHWRGRGLRQRLQSLFGLLYDFLRMEWAVRLILDSLGRAVAFLGAVADVMEGPGAILWALAVFLLVLLAIVGR